MQFEVHYRAPPVADWDIKDAHPYSMYGFLQLITDGSPKKNPREKEKQGEEEKRMPADTWKKNNRQ